MFEIVRVSIQIEQFTDSLEETLTELLLQASGKLTSSFEDVCLNISNKCNFMLKLDLGNQYDIYCNHTNQFLISIHDLSNGVYVYYLFNLSNIDSPFLKQNLL